MRCASVLASFACFCRGVILLVLALLLASCQECPSAGPEDDGTVDAAPPDADAAVTLPDASTDSRVEDGGPPQGTKYDFCGLPFFQLPIDGSLESVVGADIWANHLVYSRYKGVEAQKGRNIHLFDLLSCTDYRLTYQRDAYVPTIRESTIFWTDYLLPENPPPDFGGSVYRYDIDHWQGGPLFSYPFGTVDIYSNGTIAAFKQGVDTEYWYFALYVYPLDTGVPQVLVPAKPPAPFFGVDWWHLGDRYLVFTSWTDDPRSEDRDVFVHDLETGDTSHVDSTFAERQYLPRVWGDYAVWSSSLYASAPPHRLVLYHIPTGEEMDIVADDGSATLGLIHRNLVAYTTDRYVDSGYHMSPADLEIYDIDTGVYRRITTEPADLRAFRLFFPWLLAGDDLGLGEDHKDWYVLNLVQLGVVDESGHVIEGGPVLDPPPR